MNQYESNPLQTYFKCGSCMKKSGFSSMMKENFNIFHFNLFEKTAIQNYSFEFHTCSSQKIHRNEDFNCNLFEYSSSSLSTGC